MYLGVNKLNLSINMATRRAINQTPIVIMQHLTHGMMVYNLKRHFQNVSFVNNPHVSTNMDFSLKDSYGVHVYLHAEIQNHTMPTYIKQS